MSEKRPFLPTHFRLNGHRWRVVLVRYYLRHQGKRCRGLCVKTHRTIFLSTRFGKRTLRETFAHEYLHACEHELGLKITHNAIYTLEKPIIQLIRLLGEAVCHATSSAKSKRQPHGRRKRSASSR